MFTSSMQATRQATRAGCRCLQALGGEVANDLRKQGAQFSLPTIKFFGRGKLARTDLKVAKSGESPLPRLVVSCETENLVQLEQLASNIEPYKDNVDVGIDLAFDAVQHWCPGARPGHQFGDRNLADRMIRKASLEDHNLTGEGVNVVIVDRGLNEGFVENVLKGDFGGGWDGGIG